MFDRIEDTIVAISSPPGIGPRGIIRLSGPQAIALASLAFRCDDSSDLRNVKGHQRRLGEVRLESDAWVPAEAYLFRAPASYTRQDLVELHTSGSPAVLAGVLEFLVAQGARPAEPGEFTGRAFLTGAMDLTRVEGVAAIIHAQSDAQLKASETLLHGALGKRVKSIRDALVDLLALIEAGIDFAEEPIEFIASADIVRDLDDAIAAINDLLVHCTHAERLEVLPRVVLAGFPNAGKSTLFNRLTGMDRAIQSALAGTTRDAIAAPLKLQGSEAMLYDTAGVFDLRCMPDDAASSELHNRILESTMGAIESADLVLLVVDAAEFCSEALERISHILKGRRTALIVNKIDLVAERDRMPRTLAAVECLWTAQISAATGENMDELLAELAQTLFSNTDMQGASLLSLSGRQRTALAEAHDDLRHAYDLCTSEIGAQSELIAMEIRKAIHELGLLLGDVTSEEILGRIFARFCIGK